MLFIIYATGRCNLSCKYCGGSFHPNVVPWEVKYDIRLLADLVDSNDVIAFYGGEPLINLKFIKKVVEVLDTRTYVLQTNGLLLGELTSELLKVFDTILVSIDGVSSITDKYRGRGVYDKVVENVRMIHSRGYSGDIVARMTVNEDTDIYRDVCHLIDLGLFRHIHWQLNFVWTDKNAWRDPCSWVRNSYAPRLKLLMDEWLRKLEARRLIGIAPFQGVLKRLLRHENTAPPCGSGVDSFTILPDGRIISCPIAVTEEWSQVGRLGETEKSELKKYKVHITGPCVNCRYYSACGGRCLYTHIEKLWGEVGDKAICSASKVLIDLIESRYPEIMRIIKEQHISMDKILYPSYNNTVEIIP